MKVVWSMWKDSFTKHVSRMKYGVRAPVAEGFNQFDGYAGLVCKGCSTPVKRVPCKQLGVETKGRKMNSQGGHKGAISKNFYKVLLVYPVERLRV